MGRCEAICHQLPHGQGIMIIYNDKDKQNMYTYAGDFLEGKKNGYGRFYDHNIFTYITYFN